MRDHAQGTIGTVTGFDLTVSDAPGIRDFYAAVVGGEARPLGLGDHDDYQMLAADDTPRTGVSPRRGANADRPAHWLSHVTVADLDTSLERVRALGGRVLTEPRGTGPGAYAVIADPAGAVLALRQRAVDG
ncbi:MULTISPECIES: VOC family protein [Actinoalloteichus]|uniref:VOC family protein n=1 Tax=Actinoalloteichus TaxID=65496 RepID=UPI00036D3978|nr:MULTISPECIES: VOC family protein [Actinoalloteichus]